MSINEKKIVEKILNDYQENEVNKLDELIAIDKKVKNGVNNFC